MSKAKAIIKRNMIFVILILLIILFGIWSPNFLTFKNLMNICTQNAYLLLATIGMGLVMISGGTDLSIGYLMSVVVVCTAALMEWVGLPIWVAIILGIAIGCVLGAINGFAANLLNIHPMIVTLATMTVFQGISYLISGSQSIYNLKDGFKFLGQGYLGPISVPVLLAIVVCIIVHFVLKKTYFGRYIYAVGGNPEASRLAGVNVKRIKLLVFVICGFLCACAAIILTARTGSANSSMGSTAMFNCITACVIGGVSFIGGEGDVKGMIVGVLILGVLSNGMQLVGMGIYVQYVVKGIILLAAIGYDTYSKSVKVKKVASTKAAA